MHTTIKIVISSLLLAGTSAWAQSALQAVEVRASADNALVFHCANIENPSIDDVNKLLNITDMAQGNMLRKQLLAAVGEACGARQPKIQVALGAKGRLTWKPVR